MTSVIIPINRSDWQNKARTFLDHNYRQLWDYGISCALRINAVSEHVSIHEEGQLLGLADVRIKRIPFLETGIAYINGGPLVLREDGTDAERFRLCIEALIQEFVKKKNLTLRVLPSVGVMEWNECRRAILTQRGFAITSKCRAYRTFLLDLKPSMDELRKGLGQKWRNNLKRAEKVNLEITSGEGKDSFEKFKELYHSFVQRKRFDVDLDPCFYGHVQERLSDFEKFRVSLCKYEGEIIAGHVYSLLGHTAVNLFRANNEKALEHRASYLLQWDGIRHAKEQGCQWYDLGGIDPKENPVVYQFKMEIGGFDVTAPGPFELYPGFFKRTLVLGCESFYKLIQNLSKRH